jgi:hypothetical protein
MPSCCAPFYASGMGTATSPRERAAGEEALADVLRTHFAGQRLRGATVAYAHGSALPTLVLWLNAQRPAPSLVVWIAALAWAVCTLLALSLGIAARQQRIRLKVLLPGTRRVARVEFPAGERRPAASSILSSLAVVASGSLWIHGLAPHHVSPSLLAASSVSWLALATLSLGATCLEHWS